MACCGLNQYKEGTEWGSCSVMRCNKWLNTPLFLASASGDNVLYLMLFLHSLSTVCFIMFLSLLSHPLPLLFTRFLSQHSLFRQEGPLYFHRCLGVPDPACLCTVCVCVCVPVRKQLSHSAITCCTAETDRYCPRQLSLSIFVSLS